MTRALDVFLVGAAVEDRLPLQNTAWIDEVLDRTARHELVARRLDFDTGAVTVEAASRGEAFEFTGRQLRALPWWRHAPVKVGTAARRKELTA